MSGGCIVRLCSNLRFRAVLLALISDADWVRDESGRKVLDASGVEGQIEDLSFYADEIGWGVPSSRGGQWSSAQVRYILLNPAIMGRLAYRPAVPAGVPRLSKNRVFAPDEIISGRRGRGTRSSPNRITGLSGRS